MYSDKVIVSDFYGLQKVLTMYRLRHKGNTYTYQLLVDPEKDPHIFEEAA